MKAHNVRNHPKKSNNISSPTIAMAKRMLAAQQSDRQVTDDERARLHTALAFDTSPELRAWKDNPAVNAWVTRINGDIAWLSVASSLLAALLTGHVKPTGEIQSLTVQLMSLWGVDLKELASDD